MSEHGSLAAVADSLARAEHRGQDAASIERALRRLRARGSRDGGACGQRALRVFGVPREIEQRTRWMGLYHSRFSDLPVRVCLDLLLVWSRPPVSESRAQAFVLLGLAHCALRSGDVDGAAARLDAARPAAMKAPASAAEHLLASAYVASMRGEVERTRALLTRAEGAVVEVEAGGDADAACFRARLHDQLAYVVLHGPEADLRAAHSLYDAINPLGPPFARGKRDLGLAYVAWKSGDIDRARALARAAVSHAGDGGFVRQRAIALGLLARVADEPEAREARARGANLAASLDDDDLSARLARR